MFITFEGPEGSGKTTQLARAADYLRAQGLTVLQTREPGGTPLADRIREVLLDAANTGLTPSAELLLYAAARAQHVVEKIKPALQRGEVVLCDRFADSTLAYQGYARGLDLNLVAQVNLFATGGLEPDLTLLFDLPVEVGLARAGARAKHLPDEQREDRFEREEIAFHQRLRDGYLHLAKAHAERFRVIDAAADVDAVWQRTRAILDAEVLRRRGR